MEEILNDQSSDSELNGRGSPWFQFEVDIEIEWRSKMYLGPRQERQSGGHVHSAGLGHGTGCNILR